MFWYLESLERLKAEKNAIASLVKSADWLQPVGWRIDSKLHMIFDADILTGGRTYQVTLHYPAYFPDTPPVVKPRGDDTRWSQHQFGAGGELCLEYGPDNWTLNISGRDMIESAYRLLEQELPVPDQKHEVASRHTTSLGQGLRSEHFRFLSTKHLEVHLDQVPIGISVSAALLCSYHKEQSSYFIDRLIYSDENQIKIPNLPRVLSDELFEHRIQVFRMPTDADLPSVGNFESFFQDCEQFGFQPERSHLALLRGHEIHPYFIYEKSLYKMSVVPAQEELMRLDSSREILKEKSIAILGCGSLGSKIAVMLARSNVGRFVLVDDDVLLPENFCRNDLDWRDAGSHKVDAVSRRIQLVNPHAHAISRRLQLGGQESSAAAETLFDSLGGCDLILDATANSDAFNLAAAISNRSKTPFIWAEVFGGGIGGLIARSRPDVDPSAPYMRRAIEGWFSERSADVPRVLRKYEDPQSETPLIADDAEVTVIASHAARFAIDVLLQRTPSGFPASVYAIGLSKGSVFEQPFETFPINVGDAPQEAGLQSLTNQEKIEEITEIAGLWKEMVDALNTTNKRH
jgi:hypothetical protein